MSNPYYDSLSFGGISLGGVNNTPYNWTKLINTSRDVASAWIPVEQVREQLNIYLDESQDAYLSQLELAARFYIEDYLGKAIFEQTYTLYYDTDVLQNAVPQLDFPQSDTATLEVTEVGYYNQNEPYPTTELLNPVTDYYVDPTGSKIVLVNPPTGVTGAMTNPIYAKIKVYSDVIASYPSVIHAGKLIITHLYNNRSSVVSGNGDRYEMPYGVDSLLRPYKDLVV